VLWCQGAWRHGAQIDGANTWIARLAVHPRGRTASRLAPSAAATSKRFCSRPILVPESRRGRSADATLRGISGQVQVKSLDMVYWLIFQVDVGWTGCCPGWVVNGSLLEGLQSSMSSGQGVGQPWSS
jgi:hypothetical protein